MRLLSVFYIKAKAEVFATALLGKSEGFTKWLFAVGSLLSYGVCFYFLSLALKNIPLGVAYAI